VLPADSSVELQDVIKTSEQLKRSKPFALRTKAWSDVLVFIILIFGG
jgi:hypothetical protein